MAKQSIIYLILFLLALGNISLAQNTNPFEITNRKEAKSTDTKVDNAIKEDLEVKPQKAENQIEEGNPFEVNKVNKQIIKENTPVQESEKKEGKKEVLNHALDDYKEDQANNSSFLNWTFLFALVFIAILLSINRSLILKIFKSIWYYNLTNILFRNFVSREYIYYLFLFINFVINFSLFVYLFLNKYFHLSGFQLYAIIFFIVLMIYFFKHLFIYIFELIFPSLKSILTYNFTVLLFNISLGVFLLPLNLLIAYSFDSLSVIFVYFTVVIIVFSYILRLFRGFLITYNYFNISIVHFFLYLCTFEILPLFVLYKIIVDIL